MCPPLPGSEFGKLRYRNLERDKIRALALNRGDYDAKMHLSVLAKEDLLWWVEKVQQAYRRIIHAPICYVFQTDASDTGWSVSCSSHDSWKSQGPWSREQRVLHINVREIYVVYICLTIFCSKLSVPPLIIPRYTLDTDICPYVCLEDYIERIRHDDMLLISTIKPDRAIGSQTLGRWIKTVLQLAGVDIDMCKPHSTRHAASSAAFQACLLYTSDAADE